jgi:hypothetical protein
MRLINDEAEAAREYYGQQQDGAQAHLGYVLTPFGYMPTRAHVEAMIETAMNTTDERLAATRLMALVDDGVIELPDAEEVWREWDHEANLLVAAC